jgi:hypothetical protein
MMKTVFTDTELHIAPPKPDRTTATQRRIASSEYDLFVSSHTENLMRLDQWPGGNLL